MAVVPVVVGRVVLHVRVVLCAVVMGVVVGFVGGNGGSERVWWVWWCG